MAHPGGPWDLQEAITEQRTATRTATNPLTLHLDKNAASSATTNSTSVREMRLKARLAGKTPMTGSAAVQPVSYTLRILLGGDVIKTIDITKLLARDHEIRLVPPTRATLLYSDPDQPSTREPLSRLHSQIVSQDESQTGSQNNCFLKLCFHSLGDLKAASQAFLRLGLRCKTQFKTANRSMSRTPSVPPYSGPSEPGPPPARSPYPEYGAQSPSHSQQYGGESPYSVRSYSPLPPTQSPSEFVSRDSLYSALGASNVSNVPKRTYTDMAQGSQGFNAPKHRRSIAMNDGGVPSPARRESLPVDRAASMWASLTGYGDEREGSRSRLPSSRLPSASPSVSRLGSIPQEKLPVTEAQRDISRAIETPEKPPPRRELPASIQRHISRTPSQANGSDTFAQPRLSSQRSSTEAESTAANTSATPKTPKSLRMVEQEVQTEKPFIEPEVAFLAGMEAFQDLSSLKDQMLKECMNATRRLGEGGFVEEEARLIACYAIEFRTRFLAICSQRTGLLSKSSLMGGPSI